MMNSPSSPNHRASLLSGLRTGGVRSVSSPLAQAPHTASPSGAFMYSRKSSLAQQYNAYPAEDGIGFGNYGYQPQTAAVDSLSDRMMLQQHQQQQLHLQQRGVNSSLNANSPAFVPGGKAALVAEQASAQTDIARYLAEAMLNPHTTSAQETMQFFHQYNKETGGALQPAYVEAVQMTMLSNQLNRVPAYNAPATANVAGSFNQDQARRGSFGGQAFGEDRIPQSASLTGRFATRALSQGAIYEEQPSTPGRTTVISGGTALGTPTTASANAVPATSTGPSKSEAAVSWRRGSVNNSMLGGNRARDSPSPTVRITPPPVDRELSAPATPTSAGSKARPRPLSLMATQAVPRTTVIIDDADDTSSNASSVKSSEEHSSPTTPNSFTSCDAPLSPREAATKKLYEGLGFGRPAPAVEVHPVVNHTFRSVSHILRQPIGPPSNSEEFAPKNFASRIRRKAVGGLGVLMSGRERRLSQVGLAN